MLAVAVQLYYTVLIACRMQHPMCVAEVRIASICVAEVCVASNCVIEVCVLCSNSIEVCEASMCVCGTDKSFAASIHSIWRTGCHGGWR